MSNNLEYLFFLLIAFQVKHFIADFPLQREYMLRKTLSGWDFFVPLAVHCGVHAFLSLLIILYVNPVFWGLALVDFVAHFIMDRIKSGPKYLGRFNDKSKPGYWNALGFDQMIHHLTGFGMIWILLTYA